MPMTYDKRLPYYRKVSNTIRKGKKVAAITLEGAILSDNGIKPGSIVNIMPVKKGIKIEVQYAK